MVPRQPARREQPLNLTQALMLIVAILMLVFSAKSALKGQMALWLTGSIALVGLALLVRFVRQQLSAATPMVDMRLFTHRIILSGVMMAMTALITLVGFELLMAQELQFVHGKTPFEAGLFMLPLMLASGFSGPVAGVMVSRGPAAGGNRRYAAERAQFPRSVDDRFQLPAVAGMGIDDSLRLQRRQRIVGFRLRHYGGGAERESGGGRRH